MKQIKTLTVNGETYQLVDTTAPRVDDTTVGEHIWSGKHILDRLCLPIRETGPAVVCQPVEGYPLEVVSAIGEGGHSGVTLWHGGQNLFDFVGKLTQDSIVSSIGGVNAQLQDGVLRVWGANNSADYKNVLQSPRFGDYDYPFPAGTYSVPNGLTVQLRDNVTANQINYNGTFTLDKTWYLVYFYVTTRPNTPVDMVIPLMMVAGSEKPTAYEPYRGQTHTVEFGKTVYGGSYDWTKGVLTDENGNETQLTPTELPALPGTNTLYSNTGDTTVTGRTDPAATVERLTNAIVALGGNL